MLKTQTARTFDLEERTFNYARECRDFVNLLSKTPVNLEYSKQLIRSSSSQAANYIEANESLSRKDYFHRVRICRKEAKETRLWLRLCEVGTNERLPSLQQNLITESIELTRIFGAILEKEKRS